jgi:hypothetical protein
LWVAEGEKCDFSVPPIDTADRVFQLHDARAASENGKVMSKAADEAMYQDAREVKQDAY